MISILSRPVTGRTLVLPAAAALIAVSAVHLVDGPGSLPEHFYIGALELALASACVPLCLLLMMRPTRPLWCAALALNLAALAMFVASRTVGLPGSTDDIGNWGQLLGVVNLLSEGALIATALTALWSRR